MHVPPVSCVYRDDVEGGDQAVIGGPQVLPVGTVVLVTELYEPARQPWRGIVAGYDLGRTKYHLRRERGAGRFHEQPSMWAFVTWCTDVLAAEDAQQFAVPTRPPLDPVLERLAHRPPRD